MSTRITLFAFVFLAGCLMVSCAKQDENTIPYNTNNPLLGIWIDPIYSDTLVTMKRATTFASDAEGLEFKADGSFIRRANSGDCGTPPIVYANYTGTYTVLDDNTIYIETEYWGGSTILHLAIKKADANTLAFKYIR